jgi:hypothetical protein
MRVNRQEVRVGRFVLLVLMWLLLQQLMGLTTLLICHQPLHESILSA